jgi:hypothetical protein
MYSMIVLVVKCHWQPGTLPTYSTTSRTYHMHVQYVYVHLSKLVTVVTKIIGQKFGLLGMMVI